MTLRRVPSRGFVLPLLVVLIFPQGLMAQPDKVAALKQSLAANAKLQKQYRWIETTVISMKGEEKSRIQKQCFYGPDGKVQKQQLTAPPPPEEAPGGMKGKIAAKKKAEITAAMKQAVALVQSYVPPDPQRIQAVKAAGNLAMSPTGPDSIRLDLRNYVKSGDTLSLGLDTARYALQTVSVKSYLESEKDEVTLEVTFARLRDGLSYPGNVVLSVPGQKIQVVIQNSGYLRLTPAQPAATTAPAAAKPAAASSASTTALDNLLAPIALYPDALIAQILEGSKDFAAVQKFAGWLKANGALKGTELQDAAQKAGFATCYIALAPFPQVIQMLVEKPDWTKQLGAAFTSDQDAVYLSVQRLRAAALALGNLKTTPQQEVVKETTATGQQVIIVQPANPQVVYVPVYNTQVVYVQQAPPPPPPSASSSDVAAAALVGFTVGIIIGASSNHYYYGPYAWHGGGAAYHQAYERREDYYDNRQDYAEDRRDNAQGNQSQRQSTSQNNQSQRQSTSQTNQSQRQSTAQTSQSTRQTTASTGSGGSGETAQANQANRQSTAQGSQSQRQSTAQSSQSQRQSTAQSGGGYQGGASARSQSARGSSSRASSGGGRRR
jgi:hypothetical protein